MWSTEAGGLQYVVKVWKNISLWVERRAEERRMKKTWYFGLSAQALSPRTDGKTCGTKNTTEKTPVLQTPQMLSLISFRKAMDYDLLTQTQPNTRTQTSVTETFKQKNETKQKIYFAMIKKKKLIVKYKSLYIRLFYFCVAYLKRKQS